MQVNFTQLHDNAVTCLTSLLEINGNREEIYCKIDLSGYTENTTLFRIDVNLEFNEMKTDKIILTLQRLYKITVFTKRIFVLVSPVKLTRNMNGVTM